MTCSRPSSGLLLLNSCRSVCSPVSYLQITKVPEAIPTKSLKPKGYPTGATSTNTPGNLFDPPAATTETDERGKRSGASGSSVIRRNATPSSRSKSAKTKTRATTKTRREFLSETSAAFPAEVSKMDLRALARSVKTWGDLKRLVKQQRRKDEQFILRLLKLERLQIKTIETERNRDRSKHQSNNGVASPSFSSADPSSPPLRSMSNPSISAAKRGCGQDVPPAKQGTSLDAVSSAKSQTTGGSNAAADTTAKRRTALATRPRSSYNCRDGVSRGEGKTVAERRSGQICCISPDLSANHRNHNATPLRLTSKELKGSVRIMLGLPQATPSHNRQN